MGNCMNACLARSEEHPAEDLETTKTLYPQQKQPRREVFEEGKGAGRTEVVSSKKMMASPDGEGSCKDIETGKKGREDEIVRVKIVLTKKELQWLMMQLKSDCEKRLENMLGGIERGRKRAVCGDGKGNGWKPSLESITETPECV